jgi:hypothetical protein
VLSTSHVVSHWNSFEVVVCYQGQIQGHYIYAIAQDYETTVAKLDLNPGILPPELVPLKCSVVSSLGHQLTDSVLDLM